MPLDPSQLAADIQRVRGLHTAFVVVGGIATARYVPGRQTDDLDILVPASTAEQVYAELEQMGAVWLGVLTIGGSSYRMPGGIVLDVLASEAPWAPAAVAHPLRTADGLPIIALPYLVALKLDAGRQRDLRDLVLLLGTADEAALGSVRAVIGETLPEATADLESLIQLGRLEREAQHTHEQHPDPDE